jgi:hypothetical protein
MKAILRTALLAAALSAPAAAQPVLAPTLTPAPPPPTPPPIRRAVPSAVETSEIPPTPWTYGALALRPHIEARSSSAHDLRDRYGTLNATTLREFSPGLRADLGENWRADATVTWNDYTNAAFRDTFGETALLAGYVTVADWHVHLAHTYLSDDTSRTETGRQTRQEINTTTIGLVRAFGEHWTSETSVTRDTRLVVDAPDAREWRVLQGVNWNFSPALTLSGGAVAGRLNLDPGADLDYVRPAAELAWRPGAELTLSAEAGAERRWRVSGDRAPHTHPVGAFGAAWRPVEQTELTLRAEESLAASYFENQLDRQRLWTVGLRQRFLGKIIADVQRGAQRTHFLDTGAGGAILRRDLTQSWQCTVSIRVLVRGTLGLFWRSSHNHSAAAYAYHARQTGAAFSFAY